MSDNYDDRDELAKKMGFDSWEAFLNFETKDISEEKAKENYQSRKEKSEKDDDKENLEETISYWSWLDDKENLEENIQIYIYRNNLEGKFREDIKKEDPLFYRALINRRLGNLLPEPEPEPKKRKPTKWSWLDDKENLEENLQKYISRNNLEFKEIYTHDNSLYQAIKKRGLEDIAHKSKVFTRALPILDKYSKEELKMLQHVIYQRLFELEEE